jgi:hypothetical protein
MENIDKSSKESTLIEQGFIVLRYENNNQKVYVNFDNTYYKWTFNNHNYTYINGFSSGEEDKYTVPTIGDLTAPA